MKNEMKIFSSRSNIQANHKYFRCLNCWNSFQMKAPHHILLWNKITKENWKVETAIKVQIENAIDIQGLPYTGWLLIVDIWNKLHKSTHSLCSWCLLKVQVDCQWWSGIQPSVMEATHLCIFTLTSGDYKSPPQFNMHHSANLLFNHTKIFIGTSEIPYFWV